MDRNKIIVLDTDQKQIKNLCTLLADHNYESAQMNSIKDIERYLGISDCRVVILNLDNLTVSNRTLKELKRKKPSVKIIAVSQHQFHPELEESLRDYFFACLSKPVDPDELIYWLKSIFENNESTC